MRFCTILIILFFSINLTAQNGDSAVLVLSENSYDFGRIWVDKGLVSHTFLFKNEGNIPLRITNIRTTSGCIIPAWTKDPVAPGKEGTIIVKFNPENKTGAFHKTIQIQSTAVNANMFLTIKGTVIPAFKKEALPYKAGELGLNTKFVNFGYLFKGNTGIELVTFSNNSTKPLDIDFDSVPSYLQLTAFPSNVQPGEYGQIEIQYFTDRINDWDVIIDQIAININGKMINPKLTITANIREDFSKYTSDQLNISPVADYNELAYTFDTINTTNPVECAFMLTNDGQSDLIIRAIKPSCGCTAVIPEKNIITPGDSTYIRAVFHPNERKGDFKTGITVVTNDPKLYKQYLWMEGYIKR